MNREDRAKQFVPFDALKGLREALQQKEIEHERQQKKELSDDETNIIQDELRKLRKRDEAEVVYFNKGYYLPIKGVIERIETVNKYLQINGIIIFFAEIFKIKKR